MKLEQRYYDHEDLLIGEPIDILPGKSESLTPRISGHFVLENGESPDYYVDLQAKCHTDGNEGQILFEHPITGMPMGIAITARMPMHRFETREDDGTPGAVEWHLLSIEE